jgi:hypothetical protein
MTRWRTDQTPRPESGPGQGPEVSLHERPDDRRGDRREPEACGRHAVASPVVSAVTALGGVLDSVRDVPTWAMTAEELRSSLIALTVVEARVAELRLRLLAAADGSDVGSEVGASSTAAWVAHATRQVRAVAHREVALALALDRSHPVTQQALAAGRLNRVQAEVVVRAVQALPESVSALDRDRAETHLVALASEHDAKALALLGRRVLEVVAPDVAEEDEGRRLRAEEAAAARACYLHLWDNGDGTHTGRFKVPTLQAVMLTKMLHALAAPQHSQCRARVIRADEGGGTGGAGGAGRASGTGGTGGTGGVGGGPSRPEVLGRAFCDLVERVPAERLPRAGGVSATVVVLLDYDQLLSGLGTARLDTGEPMSAALARRLACEAGIIPVVHRRVLGGPSVVLDMGRRRRYHTEHQRIALAITQGGCTAEGCDRPPGWCHAHHDQVPWAAGGGTSVERGRLLCGFHHRRAHDPVYDTDHLPGGTIAFHRRS